MVDNNKLLNFVKPHLKDKGVAGILSDIITGKIIKVVRCMSKKCKGRHVGDIYDSGKVRGIKDTNGKMYLRSSRTRFDKEIGFECWCGNDSRIAPAEQGIMKDKNAPPTRAEIEKIFNRVENDRQRYKTVNGKRAVDGFLTEEV